MTPQIKNLKTLSDAVKTPRENFIVGEVNDSCLRLAVHQGGYNWHHHSNSDELFVVLEGELTIEFRDRPTVKLKSGDTLTVPVGVVHRTIAQTRTVNLCFEKMHSDTVFDSDFDESLLENNMEKTVDQRLLAHDSALEVAREFQRAGKELYKNINEPQPVRDDAS